MGMFIFGLAFDEFDCCFEQAMHLERWIEHRLLAAGVCMTRGFCK